MCGLSTADLQPSKIKDVYLHVDSTAGASGRSGKITNSALMTIMDIYFKIILNLLLTCSDN